MSRKLELAMRIALDLAQAQQELPKFDQALAEVEQSGKAGAKGLDAIEKSGKDAGAALDRAGKQAGDAADALERTGKSGAAGAKGLDATETASDGAAKALGRTEKEAQQSVVALERAGKAGTAAGSGLQAVEVAATGTMMALDRIDPEAAQASAALERSGKAGAASAAGLNASAQAAKGVTTAHSKLRPEVDRSNETLRQGGLSAGEYKNAMRTLPAQITDIVTGLASGQSVWMVAIQQGGQLKDQFGGLGPAASALLGAINPVTVAVTAGAAALAGIAIAAYQGGEEIRDLQATLLLAGRDAGNTSAKLLDVSESLGKLPGATTSSAIEALEAVAATGHYTATQIELIGTAAEKMRLATGRAIQDTVAEFEAIRKEPVAAILELNDKYNFLTQAQLTNIETLKEQGNQQAAVSAAFAAFAGMIDDRTPRIVENAGWIEKAWRKVRDEVLATVDAARDLGRDPGVEQQIKTLQQEIAYTRDAIAGGITDKTEADVRRMEQQLAALRRSTVTVQMAGIYAPVDSTLAKQGQAAADSISKGLDQGAAKAEKLKKATADLAKEFRTLRDADPTNKLLQGVSFGTDGSVSGGAYDKRVQQLQTQFKETTKKAPKTEAQKDDAAAQRELERLKQQITLVGTLDDTKKKATETSRIQAAIDDGNFQNASEATKQQLLQQAQLLDAANLRVESDKQLLAVRQQIAALQGGKEDGDILKARRELEKLRDDLTAQGRNGDATDVSKLLNLKQASTDLTNLRQQYNQVMADIQLESQRIQVEQQAGLLTEADAQQKIVDLYKSKLGTLHELVPQMRAAATALGDPSALSSVAQIEVKLQEMEATTNRLQETVRTTFQSAFQNSLMSLVTASNSLSEAVQNFFVSIAQGMAQMVAQDWAQKIGNWASTAASSLVGTGTDTAAAATQTTAAAATQTAAVSLTAAGTTVATGATAVGASATTLTGAASALLPGAAAISTAAVQLQSAAATMLAANAAGSVAGFASGGWTGPGGKYTAVGTVHANEFVIRSESTRQSGAIPFLADFNRRGMAALESWRGYAEGGLVSAVPVSVAAPRYQLSDAGSQPNVNRMRVYVLQNEDQLVERLLKHPKTEKAIVVTAGANGAAIRAEW